MEERRWIIVAAGVAGGVLLFGAGLLLGALVASSGEGEAAVTSTATSLVPDDSSTATSSTSSTTLEGAIDPAEIPQYGTQQDRDELFDVLRNSGVVTGSEAELLATADEICYHLERLEAQGRSAAFAVRVVWNEALAPLESEDLATFGTVFVAAPHFLCPESAAYAEDVSYWLGY